MGVPQFFHWLVTHYEKHLLREDYSNGEGVIKPDYLYLDFNCGIHPAAKQDGIETMEEMYHAICQYLLKIVEASPPKKLLYIAIDGVAPLAKMKQQRIRRFKVVQDKKDLARINARHNKKVDDRFDFNMISPGTEFMETLSLRLKSFISGELKRKLPKLRILLSDASEPGEGEHKIMAHIRSMTEESDRIVVYGLDSDLIFLSLLHYRPNFCLLREKIFFGSSDDSESKFTFFDIGKFREILLAILTPELSRAEMIETGLLETSKERKIDIPIIDTNFFDDIDHAETLLKSIDSSNQHNILKSSELRRGQMKSTEAVQLILDYVVVCFILGNDFLPYLASLKIKEGGLNRVLECYKLVQEEMVQNEVVGNAGCYLVNGFTLNKKFFMKWLEYIVCYEETDLKQHTENRETRVSKFKKSYRYRTAEDYDRDVMEFEYIEDKSEDTLKMGYPYWQYRYYKYYIGDCDQEILDRWVKNYLEGILWILRYYQGNGLGFSNGMNSKCCPDWGWQYHFRAGPPASLMFDFLKRNPDFELDYEKNIIGLPMDPVKPYEQLMMILPPQSSQLIHPKLVKLMTNVDSPIVYLYPTNFQIDTARHRFRWECYPILPDLDMEKVRRTVDLVMNVEKMTKTIIINSNNKELNQQHVADSLQTKKSIEEEIERKQPSTKLSFKKTLSFKKII